MNLEKFTDRAKGFLQSRADRRHPHEPSADRPRASAEGAARGRAGHGRRPDRARPAAMPKRALARDRCGAGAKSPPSRAAARNRRRASTTTPCACSTRPNRSRPRRATASSPSSGCCSRWRWPRTTAAGKALATAGVTPKALNAAINELARGPHRRHRGRGGPLRRAQEIRPRPDRRRRATASSTPSSAATRKSAAPSRSSPAAPRTTPC